MKRITVPMVKEAYKFTGFIPKQGRFFSEEGKCACPLGALYAFKNGIELSKSLNDGEILLSLQKDYDAAYLRGFANGFDNNKLINATEKSSLGYHDGIMVKNALFNERVLEEESLRGLVVACENGKHATLSIPYDEYSISIVADDNIGAGQGILKRFELVVFKGKVNITEEVFGTNFVIANNENLFDAILYCRNKASKLA